MGSLLHAAAFQGVWFACVLGAAAGHGWLGPCAAVAFLAATLWRSPRRDAEAALILKAAVLGLALDSLLTAGGALEFAAPGPLGPGRLAPPWIVALWAGFATLLPRSLSWLQGRLWLAAVVGAVAGPMTYVGAASFGAAEVLVPTPTLVVLVGLEYACALPLLALVSRAASAEAPSPTPSQTEAASTLTQTPS
jgi:hypothetical protein